MNDNLLEDFLLRIFEDRNVPCHETSRGVLEILLTPELAREQGLPMHLKITGDPEPQARFHPCAWAGAAFGSLIGGGR